MEARTGSRVGLLPVVGIAEVVDCKGWDMVLIGGRR